MPVRAVPNVHRLTLALLAALALPAFAQEASTQTDASGKSVKTLDRMTVTGSRIKRAEIEQALPITSFTKEQIDAQGITSAEQLLAYMNIASNGPDNLASNVGIVGETLRGDNGVSGANLRGQGADATLVLLNGRRVTTHGLKGRAVDLNGIPFAAIERVEVLRDGASAIYGTDAIGGVINFITKRDYQGAQVSGFVDVTEAGGANIYRSSLLFGHGDLDRDGWNAFGTLSVKRNTILRGNERDFSSALQPDRGLQSPDTSGTPFATVFNRPTSTPTLIGNGLRDPLDNSLQQGINTLNLPGAEGCASGDPAMAPYDYLTWNVPVRRYACSWDYAAAAVMQQPQDSVDFIGRATFRVGNAHEAYVELVASKVEVTKSFEAIQISPGATFGPSTWYPLNDATKATYDGIYNDLAAYFGAGQLNYGKPIAYRWRCVACGPRAITTTTDAYRFVAGIGGLIGEWSYDVGLTRGSSQSKSTLGSGYLYTDALQLALGSGNVNPFLLPGQEQTSAGQAALDAGSAAGVVLYGGETVLTVLDASISGEVGFNLWGGAISMATGVDLRREEYKFNGDERATKRSVFGAPFDDGNALDNATRDIRAAYVELYLPVFKNFDLNLAGRYDHYSGFGATTNPKVSFKYKPFDVLLFRGAYSTGFKVPNFNQLFNDPSPQPYVGKNLVDPETCPTGIVNPNSPGCESINPDEIFGGNPDLAPEESTQKSVGFVYSPMEFLNVSVDWWEIERENSIRSADRTILLQNYDLFAANFIRDSNGDIVAIDRRFINSGGSLTRGVELDANLLGELAGGRWNINLNGSFLSLYKTKALETLPYGPNLIGKYVQYANLPIRWKHTLNFGYARGVWSHSLSQIHRDGYFDELPDSAKYDPIGSDNVVGYLPPGFKPRVEGYTIYNYSVTWTGIDKLKVGLGIKNLLDTDPPFTAHKNDFAAGAGWEPRIADPRGRAYTLLVEYSFW